MNNEERNNITEDGKWPLLKTRPDNLPERRGSVSAQSGGSESTRRTTRSRQESRDLREERETRAPRRTAQENRQQRSRNTEASESEKRQRRAEEEERRRRQQAAARERANSSKRTSGNGKKKKAASEASVGDYFRELPARFSRFLKDPTGDIPFLIGLIVAVVLIILIISLIVRAAVDSGSSRASVSDNSVSTVSSSATATPAPAYTPTDIRMSFVGDVLLGMDENTSYSSSFNAFYDLNGADYFLQNVKSVFAGDDVSVVNLEGTLTDETTRADKDYAYKADPSYVSILSDASIEAADVANDHTSDYGDKSLTDTISALESANISHFGNADVAVITVRGITVGLYGIDQMDDATGASASMTSAVQKLKDQNANIIIGYFHWGTDQDTCPTQEMVDLAHSAIDAGTDLVVGSGSHLLEGIEYYNNRTIAYGLGSFCYGGDTNPSDVNTMILQPTFSISAQGTITNTSLNIIPCQMCSDTNYNDYQPKILTGDEGQAVLDELDERSTEITSTFSDITTVYNSKTDGTVGVNGAGLGEETVEGLSSTSSSSSDTSLDGTVSGNTGLSTGTTDTTGTAGDTTSATGANASAADTDTTTTTGVQ